VEGGQKEGYMCGASHTRWECRANRNATILISMARQKLL